MGLTMRFKGLYRRKPAPITVLLVSLFTASAALAADTEFKLGKSTISIFFAPDADNAHMVLSRQEITNWIQNAAKAVAGFYGEFPVEHVQLSVNASDRKGLHGTAFAGKEPLINLRVSKNANRKKLDSDWVLVHEMVHLAFPSVHRRHHWLEEGLATYVEPLARVKAGLMSEDDAWRWLLEGTPNGLPEAGDKGLDHTPTWGRTYWGGALFCLLADIRIREQTANQFGIRHALQAIQQAGGTMEQEGLWPMDKTLAIGDKATGTRVLSQLYAERKSTAVDTNLDAIWKQLGVALENGKVVYDDTAPQADIRKALIRG